MEDLERRILRILMNPLTYSLPSDGATPEDIADFLGVPEEEVETVLKGLVGEGKAREEKGCYSRNIKGRRQAAVEPGLWEPK